MKLSDRKVSGKLFKLPLYSLLSLLKQGTLSLDRHSLEAQQLFSGSSAEAGLVANSSLSNAFLVD